MAPRLHLSGCLPVKAVPAAGGNQHVRIPAPLALFVSVIEGKVMRDLIALGPFLQPV